MTFTLATWNINSVRLREALVPRLMAEEMPDVLCLQECKSPVEKIPLEAVRGAGLPRMSWRAGRRATTAWRSCRSCRWRRWRPRISRSSAMPGTSRRGWRTAW